MTTADFISGFINDTLGRKTTHGTFRVLKGQHCKLLVSSTRSNNKPAGHRLIGIQLFSPTNKFTWFSSSLDLRRGLCSTAGIDKYQRLPGTVFHGNTPNLLSSGIVDTSDYYSVIEIGDVPYLFTHGNPSSFSSYKIKEIEALESRVSTIQEALELIKLPKGCVIINKNIIAKPMPNDFAPQEIDKESKQLLITPPNPLDFGYSFEECIPTTTGMLVPMDTDSLLSLKTTREIEWNKAKNQYDIAHKLWHYTYPYSYACMDIKKLPHQMSNTTRAGRLIVSSNGVFFKGQITSTEFSNTSTTVLGWHKYISTKHIYTMTLG